MGQLGAERRNGRARPTPDLEGAHAAHQQTLADAEGKDPPLSALDRTDLQAGEREKEGSVGAPGSKAQTRDDSHSGSPSS
jgi:hypothetical protein